MSGRDPGRRAVLAGLGAGAGVLALGMALPRRLRAATARRLEMPALLDARESGAFALTAQAGAHDFLGEGPSATQGFNGDYLGPVIKLRQGAETAARVENSTDAAISAHWHGLEIPGEADGGPHQPVAPGTAWETVLPIRQPAATAWYHSHIHGRTAPQVYAGLAGVLHIDDGQDTARGLPATYGEDDLTLVLQDRRFDQAGRMSYGAAMRDRMTGFLGDWMVVNGQVDAVAAVPPGVVRLRLLNASNARIYRLSMRSGRQMHLLATDGGYLPRVAPVDRLLLAPGERAELLVDFRDAKADALMSDVVANMPMLAGGEGLAASRGAGQFVVQEFAVDRRMTARIDRIADDTGAEAPAVAAVGGETRRDLTLDMGMGMMGMMRGFSINGASFDMGRVNLSAPRGQAEIWRISAERMMHPFHIHGTQFSVLSENGKPPRPEYRGWKDTVLIDGVAEVLVRFPEAAPEAAPYMYHCHILEHEDAGMMGQFTVS